MVKNMKNYNLIKSKIETIFRDLKIDYEYVDFQDDDINYLINFNTYGKLKSLNSIKGIIYFHYSDFSMNFIVLNIYNLDDENMDIDTLDIYEAVNDINSELLYGSFLIEDNKHIFYRSSINCGKDYAGFDTQILKRQLDVFADGLVNLFNIIINKEHENE